METIKTGPGRRGAAAPPAPPAQAAQAAQVQAAQAAGKPPVIAYAQNDQTKLGDGALVAASNSISTGTGTIMLKATFPNTERHLWPGQFVNAHLQLTVERNVVTVPIAAIQHGPDGLYIFVVGQDSTTTARSPRWRRRAARKSAT